MPDEVVAPVRRNAWWRRVSGRMDKASTAFSSEMHGLAAPGRKLDDAFYDDLTEVLIAADCGVELSERLVAALRQRARHEKLGDGAAAIAALKAEILAVMNTYDRSLHLREIPSVVLVATDAAGNALPNVKVSIDSAPPRALDGTSWDVDPGPHTFTFVGEAGTRVEKQVLAVQGTKDQRVVVALIAASGPVVVTPETSSSSSTAGPWKPLGYTMLAVGAAGLVVGGVFGALALSTKSSDCKADLCNRGTSSTALTQGDVSTAGFVAGGVLAAAGITVLLLAPKAKEQTGGLEAAPLVGGGTTGLVFRGSF